MLTLIKNLRFLAKIFTGRGPQKTFGRIQNGKPKFTLKQPFFSIAKHSSVDECSAWQGLVEDVRTLVMAEPQMHIARFD